MSRNLPAIAPVKRSWWDPSRETKGVGRSDGGGVTATQQQKSIYVLQLTVLSYTRYNEFIHTALTVQWV